MKSYIVAALAAFVSTVAAADGVKGSAEGFAKGISHPSIRIESSY
jgi:pectin lyase